MFAQQQYKDRIMSYSHQSSMTKKTEECRHDVQRARSELEALGQLIGSKTQHIECLELRLNGYLAELLSVPDTRDTDLKVARIEEDSLVGQQWPSPRSLPVLLPSSSLSGNNTAFASYDERRPDDPQQP